MKHHIVNHVEMKEKTHVETISKLQHMMRERTEAKQEESQITEIKIAEFCHGYLMRMRSKLLLF